MSVEREHAARQPRARFGGRNLAVRMDDGDEQAVGHRQADQVERVVASDEHDPAEHGRGDVVRVGRAAGRTFAGHRALHERLGGERAAEDLVGRNGAGRR